RVDQRERWELGERRAASDYLDDFPGLRGDPEAALEMIYAEWLLREERGESPALEDYRRAYPEHAEGLAVQVEVHRALRTDCWDGPPGDRSGPTNRPVPVREVAGARRDPARAGGFPAISGYEVL